MEGGPLLVDRGGRGGERDASEDRNEQQERRTLSHRGGSAEGG